MFILYSFVNAKVVNTPMLPELQKKVRRLLQQKSIKAPGKIIANTELVNRTILVSANTTVTGLMDKKRAKVS